jgi:xylulokinase
VEGVVGGLLAGLDALHAAGVDVAGGRLLVAGGGARSAAYLDVLERLSGREVTRPVDGDEVVARGACVQAAAVLAQRPLDEVIVAWT